MHKYLGINSHTDQKILRDTRVARSTHFNLLCQIIIQQSTPPFAALQCMQVAHHNDNNSHTSH